MGATIGGTIKDTIGCLIIDAIFPPHRHAETARGDDSETGDEQGQTARGTGRVFCILYGCRGKVLE